MMFLLRETSEKTHINVRMTKHQSEGAPAPKAQRAVESFGPDRPVRFAFWRASVVHEATEESRNWILHFVQNDNG